MKLSALKTNVVVLEQGRWVDDIPDMEGVRLHVRGLGNTDYKRLYLKKSMAVPRKDKVRGLKPEDNERIVSECLHEAILLDWSGITDDAGKEIAYTPEQARELLTTPEFVSFRTAVIWAASLVSDDAGESAETDAGN